MKRPLKKIEQKVIFSSVYPLERTKTRKDFVLLSEKKKRIKCEEQKTSSYLIQLDHLMQMTIVCECVFYLAEVTLLLLGLTFLDRSLCVCVAAIFLIPNFGMKKKNIYKAKFENDAGDIEMFHCFRSVFL